MRCALPCSAIFYCECVPFECPADGLGWWRWRRRCCGTKRFASSSLSGMTTDAPPSRSPSAFPEFSPFDVEVLAFSTGTMWFSRSSREVRGRFPGGSRVVPGGDVVPGVERMHLAPVSRRQVEGFVIHRSYRLSGRSLAFSATLDGVKYLPGLYKFTHNHHSYM
jgi:hypothetical protein